MDFSVPGSDDWESTRTQDLFIESYFHHKEEPLSGTAQSKKRKMVASDKTAKKIQKLESAKDLQSTDKQDQLVERKTKKRKKKGKKVLESEEDKYANHPETCSSSKDSVRKIKKIKLEVADVLGKKLVKKSGSKETESTLLEENTHHSPPVNMKSGKKFHNSKSLSVNPCALNSKALSSKPRKMKLDPKGKSNSHSECSREESMPGTNKRLKLNQKTKLKSSKHLESHKEESSPSVVKKSKKKKALKSDVQLENVSEDESDDEKIISEIKESSIFKEIQKLMKEAPELQNLKDSDDSMEETSGSCSESDMSENKVNLPRSAIKSCDFPRAIIKDSSDSISIPKNLDKHKDKLRGAKFRYLNEKLYTDSGDNAFKYFQENEEEYHDYHTGYSIQVSKWPMNPVDKILSDLEEIEEGTVIADMGCGDAKIAATLTNSTVHSFDIVALNDLVTPCNISKVPLAKESVDIVVFCLSLMGTNLKEYLLEAHRILKMGGTLKIAEVESRIEDVNIFIKKLSILGFSIQNKDLKHKMFVFLDFKKVTKKVKKDKIPTLSLKPCLYKKR